MAFLIRVPGAPRHYKGFVCDDDGTVRRVKIRSEKSPRWRRIKRILKNAILVPEGVAVSLPAAPSGPPPCGYTDEELENYTHMAEEDREMPLEDPTTTLAPLTNFHRTDAPLPPASTTAQPMEIEVITNKGKRRK